MSEGEASGARAPGGPTADDPLGQRIEAAMARAVATLDHAGAPPRLRAAVRHALFPAGGRLRPRLTLSVARACGDGDPSLADAAAVAIELLHGASLVHDDLPAFDDARVRRGRPSVHAAFGEPLALLAGDGLIVLAFETLAAACGGSPRLAPLMAAVARGVGAREGLVAGQAWESEPEPDLAAYHRAKTAALFAAAAAAGAIAAGGDGPTWHRFGGLLGEAYQVADDIADRCGDPAALGKPVGQDAARGRPNAHRALGAGPAEQQFADALRAARAAVPPAAWTSELERLLARSMRLLPREIADRVASQLG
jgi:geranylgeranyl diphosphate synthase type II